MQDVQASKIENYVGNMDEFSFLEVETDDILEIKIDDILEEKKITLYLKRGCDILFSAVGLVCLMPVFLVIAALIKLDSPGPVFFKQTRIGKDGKEFYIYKFRKMRLDVGNKGLNITTANDSRMTKFGGIIRKYKIDELPQAWNVLKGDMHIVGPRPETPNYVELYTKKQRDVLKVKPGITDYASIAFIDEGDLLEKALDPETYYIQIIMPDKIRINELYIRDMSLMTDTKIVMATFGKIFIKVRGAIK